MFRVFQVTTAIGLLLTAPNSFSKEPQAPEADKNQGLNSSSVIRFDPLERVAASLGLNPDHLFKEYTIKSKGISPKKFVIQKANEDPHFPKRFLEDPNYLARLIGYVLLKNRMIGCSFDKPLRVGTVICFPVFNPKPNYESIPSGSNAQRVATRYANLGGAAATSPNQLAINVDVPVDADKSIKELSRKFAELHLIRKGKNQLQKGSTESPADSIENIISKALAVKWGEEFEKGKIDLLENFKKLTAEEMGYFYDEKISKTEASLEQKMKDADTPLKKGEVKDDLNFIREMKNLLKPVVDEVEREIRQSKSV